VLGCVLVGIGSLGVPAAAQDASPVAGEVIDPTACLVAPLTDDEVRTLAATPVTQADTPEVAGSPAPFATPDGQPAAEAEVAAVTQTVRELVACLNAADYRRVYALFSEAYLVRTFAEQGAARVEATPEPGTTAQHALIGIEDVVVLADGRLGAGVETASGAAARPVRLYLVFVQEGDRWVIDEETILDAAEPGTAPPPSGTPTG
jgi:hypothetical protein